MWLPYRKTLAALGHDERQLLELKSKLNFSIPKVRYDYVKEFSSTFMILGLRDTLKILL